MLVSEFKDSPLEQRALDVVVLEHNVLLERFDCKELSAALQLTQKNLNTETTAEPRSLVFGQGHRHRGRRRRLIW